MSNIKLPGWPPAFLLHIQINGYNHFSASFASLEDLADKEKWQRGCDAMHEMLLKWLEREAVKEEQNAQEGTNGREGQTDGSSESST